MNNISHTISAFFTNLKSDIRAELSAIFQDSGALLLLVIALPLYTIIYSMAYGSEVVRNVAIGVVDEDKTSSSRELINGIISGPNTAIRYEPQSILEAQELYFDDKIFGIVYIPHGYERNLLSNTQANIGLILDGSHLLLYRQVLEQVATDALTHGATIELMRLMERGESEPSAMATIEPVTLDMHHLYNRSLGYGSFVMPSVIMVIIQQTLVIGLAMIAARRRRKGLGIENISESSTIAKILVYLTIYGVNLIIILGVVWQVFGFPYIGNTIDIALFVALYIIATLALGMAVAQLFKRRESPLLLLLSTSVPILLLAGVSYPREAYDSWLYNIGRLLPSSSGVDGFIALASRGATLSDILPEIITLSLLAIIYFTFALIINRKLQQKSRGIKNHEQFARG